VVKFADESTGDIFGKSTSFWRYSQCMLQYLSNFLRFERFNLRYSDWGRSTLQERCISDISSFDFRGRSGGVIGGEYHCVAEMFLSWSLGKAETALLDSIAGSTFHQILQAFIWLIWQARVILSNPCQNALGHYWREECLSGKCGTSPFFSETNRKITCTRKPPTRTDSKTLWWGKNSCNGSRTSCCPEVRDQ
jgi:hypothetical protein